MTNESIMQARGGMNRLWRLRRMPLLWPEIASLTRLVTPGNGVVVAPQLVVDGSQRPLCRRAC